MPIARIDCSGSLRTFVKSGFPSSVLTPSRTILDAATKEKDTNVILDVRTERRHHAVLDDSVPNEGALRESHLFGVLWTPKQVFVHLTIEKNQLRL